MFDFKSGGIFGSVMAEMYMRNIRDWRDSTLMLSFEEKGYYDELLNLIYIYDDCLPDNDTLICRAMPVNKKIHLRLKEKLIKESLIDVKDGFYFNKRASQEINKINQISEKNKAKAIKRWAKSKKGKDIPSTAVDNAVDASAVRGAMQKVKVKSEKLISKKNKTKKEKQIERFKNATKKCSLEDVLNPEGSIPKEYRDYAAGQGLDNIERIFWSWANWWASENGRKAGARGWLQTWKARVRKDIDRQNSGSSHKAGQAGDRGCSTTLGAKMALDRRRNRK